MRERLEARLEALKKEYEIGQARLKELDAEANYVRETMLRIGGAMQVLQEMLDAERQPQDAAAEKGEGGQGNGR
jgi:predicted nuclease with TOPRIM domain